MIHREGKRFAPVGDGFPSALFCDDLSNHWGKVSVGRGDTPGVNVAEATQELGDTGYVGVNSSRFDRSIVERRARS